MKADGHAVQEPDARVRRLGEAVRCAGVEGGSDAFAVFADGLRQLYKGLEALPRGKGEPHRELRMGLCAPSITFPLRRQ